jgi:hypothetical protein
MGTLTLFRFLTRVDGGLDFSDFTDIGLNRALPLAQNQNWMPSNRTLHYEWLRETNQEDHCFNCGRPFDSLNDERRWKGFFEARRCATCWLFRYKHREEKNPDFITDERMHEVWIGWGNPDVCGNPACQEPRTPANAKTFRF